MATATQTPADKKKADKKRLNIILSQNNWDRLERIRDDMEAETVTEVVKDSLRLLEYLLDVSRSGGKLYIKRPDEAEPKQVEIFGVSVK
ncbi:MAG: hypothetical protein ACFB22_12320 [Rhodothalassiaceae bacterium]